MSTAPRRTAAPGPGRPHPRTAPGPDAGPRHPGTSGTRAVRGHERRGDTHRARTRTRPHPGPRPRPGLHAPAAPVHALAAVRPLGWVPAATDPARSPPRLRRRTGKNRRGSLLVGALLLALVAGGIGGGIGAYIERNGGLTTVELPQAAKNSGGRAPDSVAGIAASALPSVVTLHVSGTTESGTGTGFVLDNEGHILTNNHVVAPAGRPATSR